MRGNKGTGGGEETSGCGEGNRKGETGGYGEGNREEETGRWSGRNEMNGLREMEGNDKRIQEENILCLYIG